MEILEEVATADRFDSDAGGCGGISDDEDEYDLGEMERDDFDMPPMDAVVGRMQHRQQVAEQQRAGEDEDSEYLTAWSLLSLAIPKYLGLPKLFQTFLMCFFSFRVRERGHRRHGGGRGSPTRGHCRTRRISRRSGPG